MVQEVKVVVVLEEVVLQVSQQILEKVQMLLIILEAVAEEEGHMVPNRAATVVQVLF